MRYLGVLVATLASQAMAASVPGGSISTTQARQGQPISLENSPEFRACSATLNNDPCVRELFHLEGSFDRLRTNCKQGDLDGVRTHNINLANFPQDKFPDGPKCGTRSGDTIEIRPENYSKVCRQCIN